MLEMLGIFFAAAAQYWRSRGDPAARAVVRWFGLSVAVGAGAFVFTVIAPSLVGLTPGLPQGYAFAFFLLIHMRHGHRRRALPAVRSRSLGLPHPVLHDRRRTADRGGRGADFVDRA
jgi:hypothetical protein